MHYLKTQLTCIVVLIAGIAYAQPTLNPLQLKVTKQCSIIREILHSAKNQQFKNIIGDQLKASQGYSTGDRWRFATTRYNSVIKWDDATRYYIENYKEWNDTSILESWQYIADIENIPDYLSAQKLLKNFDFQIGGCLYDETDSTTIPLRTLPLDSLPLACPPELQIANLYALPIIDTSIQKRHTINVMTGIEKTGKTYRVSLIIDDTRASLNYRREI
jgi:hypothetical protein